MKSSILTLLFLFAVDAQAADKVLYYQGTAKVTDLKTGVVTSKTASS